LQQGHSPGKYAQMLREILRKMSKDDSHVRLRSLEQVIKLGENIVEESEEKRKKSPVLGTSSNNATFQGSFVRNNNRPETTFTRTNPADFKMNYALPMAGTAQPQSPPPQRVMSSGPPPMKVIARSTRVPGHMPTTESKKSSKVSIPAD
jgi:hypothetical protein